MFEDDLGEFFDALVRDIGKACTSRSRGKVVAILGAQRVWEWIRNSKRTTLEEHRRVVTMLLRRWTNGAISNALDQIGLRTGSKAAGMDVWGVTRGIHSLVVGTLAQLQGAEGKSAMEAVDVALRVKERYSEERENCLNSLGLEQGAEPLHVATRHLLGMAEM